MSSNYMKGEVELEASGKTFTLCYTFDTIVSLEGKVGKGFPVIAKILADADLMTFGLVRDVLHAGLAKYHPEVTLTQAGDLVPEAGGVLKVLAVVDKAMSAAFTGTGGSEEKNPLQPTAPKTNGIGLAS